MAERWDKVRLGADEATDRRPSLGRRRRERVLILVQLCLGFGVLVAALRAPDTATSAAREGIAIVLATVGITIGAWALLVMRRHFRVVPSPKPDGELVAHGIYRWLRHPMYSAVLMVVAALTTLRPGAVVLALAAANFAFYLAKARYEEGLLLDHYPGYARYRARTWGVLPGIRA